jgi:hypothetical protein
LGRAGPHVGAALGLIAAALSVHLMGREIAELGIAA